jgi:hypothetical protein
MAGATLKSQLDAKVLVSNWFLEHATEADVQTVSLLGEAFGFAKAADDPLKSHLTRQPPLAVETFTSAVGAISFLDAITFLFSAGDFFSNPQANFDGASLAQFMNRTGLLAVLSGDNVAIKIIDKDFTACSTGCIGDGAVAGIMIGAIAGAAGVLLGVFCLLNKTKPLRKWGSKTSATVAAAPVDAALVPAASPATPQPARSLSTTTKADSGPPPPPKEHVVADSVFSIVAGKGADAISLSALSEWLIERGETPLDKVQELFNALDTDGNGSVDRQEWRVGFTAGILPK